MLNITVISGRLGTDLELKYTTTNKTPVLGFSVAVDRDYKKQGEERQTDWIRVVAWRELAKFIAEHFHKGQMITIDGRLQESRYTDKQGVEHKTYDLIANHAYFCGDDPKPQEPRWKPPFMMQDDTKDELPF